MDVSGSMTDDQKEIVRTEAFWIDTWLKSQYDGVDHPLHHPRRRRQGGRRAHLLPHPRERRHADQLGLQPGQQADRRVPLADRLEHLRASTSPTATTGAKTTASASACSATRSCPSATCSATARSKAPTDRANSTANSKRRSTKFRTWPYRKYVIRKGSTIRSRSSWDADGDAGVLRPLSSTPRIRDGDRRHDGRAAR